MVLKMEVGSGSPSEEATAQSSSHRMDFLMFCQDLAPGGDREGLWQGIRNQFVQRF